MTANGEHRPNACCDYHRHIADGCCHCENQPDSAGNDAVHEVRRAMRALYATVPAEVARDVAERVESALAQAWDEGYVAGNAFGYEWAQDTYDGPAEDPTPNPYRTTPIPPAADHGGTDA